MTDEDNGIVTLQFKDEAAAQMFMLGYGPTVDVMDMPKLGAGEQPAIPSGIYYSKLLDNFYDMASECGKGADFHGKWYDRRAEFPDESSGSGSAPVGQGSAPAFNDAAKCSPELTQCPRCNNPHHACDRGQGSADAYRGESIDMPEFRKLSYAYAEALMRGTIPQTSAAWEALIDFCNAWGASQRQEGRRDMHETNVALVNENCALSEKLAAWDAKRAAPASVPDGYVLVPKVLRQPMDEAMDRAKQIGNSNQHLWDCALDAAPSCPTCPKETPYGPATCGKCVDAGEPNATPSPTAGEPSTYGALTTKGPKK